MGLSGNLHFRTLLLHRSDTLNILPVPSKARRDTCLSRIATIPGKRSRSRGVRIEEILGTNEKGNSCLEEMRKHDFITEICRIYIEYVS